MAQSEQWLSGVHEEKKQQGWYQASIVSYVKVNGWSRFAFMANTVKLLDHVVKIQITP
jgi:hypothetical protein